MLGLKRWWILYFPLADGGGEVSWEDTVSVHNEGWAHLRESQDQLADVFAQFNLADRLAGQVCSGNSRHST
jgi:hypothetical protein